ncbi:MAG: DUF885 domain-containing protein [Deltaproteobacteria bacterium]|nr:MAG: DUF885 domain-containing protein [Deltaproteobacteria bacterium]
MGRRFHASRPCRRLARFLWSADRARRGRRRSRTAGRGGDPARGECGRGHPRARGLARGALGHDDGVVPDLGELARAEALSGKVAEEDAVTLALFIEDLHSNQRQDVCRFDEWNFSPRNNPMVDYNRLPETHGIEDAQDADNLLARYRQMAPNIDHQIAGLRRGAADGWFANAESTERVIAQFRAELAKPTDEWALLAPPEASGALSAEAVATITADMRAVIDEQIRPAYTRYVDFIEAEILPNARPGEASGLSHLPEGQACYDALVANFTTLDVDAENRHATGLAELEKIHAEFAEIGQRVFETDDVQAIFERLRTDETLYFETSEQVQDKAEEALGRAKEKMVDAFGILPQADCVVKPVPDYEAPYTTIAYYWQPNPDGSKPGEYFVNTYAPETRPRHEAEVLAFHESIPGHHLQIAISQELPDLPAFRKHMGQTAFVEGWGLYSERLSDEMGLYSGDVDRLGMLSFDAWRAGRLVVDTGIHAKGWSREQAVAFLTENTPLAVNNIDNEVDRYITMPGQALAYKTGQLEILALRAEAEAALGESFDLKAFHDVVLGGGAVSLPVLREQVEAYIAEQQSE